MRALGITIILIAAAILLLNAIQDYLAIASCLDSGKAYDYTNGECRSDAHGPYVPYFKRFSWLTTGALLAVLAGIGCVFVGKQHQP